jgi:hypothetical protein
MPRLEISAVKELKDFIISEKEKGIVTENWGTLYNLMTTIEDMQKEIDLQPSNVQLRSVKAKIINKKQSQADWKHKCIDNAIDVLTEPTHRLRDDACKKLLKHIQNMPEISSWDYGEESEELPF